ncbi:energy-coupled thiamine transporter ThiT [Thalassobacillus pellis]|uniref:energy-coupled thiamine transporter ThiT n=1 Tax=Thalassobacillus pellis TaxID=748008 RepID=UPI00196210E9|nr:energy-coupled thiamine transporter ThiT [Thalassobacillus pellis]MBM7553025.1 thiamine transporter [Thalassobacillus pellis]
MRNKKVLFMVEVAIFAALATLLDFIPAFKLPQGGSVSLAMIPVFLIAFRWGLKGGLAAGFLYGVFQILTGMAIIATPVQALIDYGIAFTVLGFTGIFAVAVKRALANDNKKKFALYVAFGVLLGSGLRFFAHVLAGVFFFAEYAGDQNVWIYSIIYNASYMVPAAIISMAGLGFLFYKQPRILLNNDEGKTYKQAKAY